MTRISRRALLAGGGAAAALRALPAPAREAGRASRPAVVLDDSSRLNEPVANLAGRDRSRTDILHEYFLPAEGLETFLAACRKIIPASRQDLLNVTLRYVEEDRTSVLAYARGGTRVAAVMLFSQRMARADDEDMAEMTRRLIDAALDAGGSFYLPYRLHARPDQVARAYPRVAEFRERKRHWDPGLLFRNSLWTAYLGDGA